MTDTTSTTVQRADELDDVGADEYTQMLAKIAENDQVYSSQRSRDVEHATALGRHFAEVAARKEQVKLAEAAAAAREAAESRYREIHEPTQQLAAQILGDAEEHTERFLQWLVAERARAALSQQLFGINGDADRSGIIRVGDAMHPAACLAMIVRPDDPRWRGTCLVGPRPRGFA